MWNGNYSFFDYKYNIEGYSGQDYDGFGRTFYMWFALISIALLVILLRNLKEKYVNRYIKVMAVVMPVLEITKVTWESIWDVRTGRGFNWGGLLPIYTCSLFMYCMLLAAFTKGKVRDWCLCWIATIGFVGGISNVIFIRGLNWYPCWTFGAFYSMFFHWVMTFTAMLIVVTRLRRFRFSDIWRSFGLHVIFSAPVIAIDFIRDWDYMQYKDAGGVPLFEDLIEKLQKAGQGWLSVPIMLAVYLALTAALMALYIGLQKLISVCKKEK